MLNSGQILDGKYEIIKILGQGGMGTVYLCKNSRLGNLWAVKEVESKWKNQIDFLAEPNILKNLNHIGIVRIVDIFFENDNLYLVEDYIEGNTLKEYVDVNGPQSLELVKNISLQLCSILNYLHSFHPPIIYRDLKPSNIIITPNNKVVLIDFGIARIYKESQEGDTVIIGSKGYIAPEQLANIQSNVQSDIYSLGATMFFMLTGKSVSLPAKHMFEENFPEHVPKSLVRIIQKALALESEKRYSDVKSIISELNAIIANDDKTIISNSRKCSSEATKTVLRENTKHIKRKNLIIIAVLVCIILLVLFRAFLASNKASEKKEVESPISSKTNLQPVEEVPEQDTIVNGMLNINNPIPLSSSNNNTKDMDKGKDKDKDKDKNKNVQFILNPAASIYNSKFSISLTSIVKMDDEVIAILNIQNTDDDALKLDLSKTYLVNGKNEPAKIDNLNNLVLIPRSTNKQELKLYFKDFNFEGSPYLLKTVLISRVNKNIDLEVEVKGNFHIEKDD
jgi:serine/threonine protein kinase